MIYEKIVLKKYNLFCLFGNNRLNCKKKCAIFIS